MSQSGIRSVFDKFGILPTPQRLEIAGILLEKPQHLSADQIIERLRRDGSAVSKATVYNTLNLFSEHGLVKEVMVDPIRKFYDSTTHPHHHFYNVDTGELKWSLNLKPKEKREWEWGYTVKYPKDRNLLLE